MNASGRTPNEILNNTLSDHSSWHFFQARSWLDLATRSQAPSAIHYAAFELRYGIEYLLFELLVLGSGTLTAAEYEKCLGAPTHMKKMLTKLGPNFRRLAEFTEIALSLDSRSPKVRFWDIRELFRYWGVASSYLHFVGAHSLTYGNTEWLIKAIAALEATLTPIWETVTQTLGAGVLRPSKMPPEVHAAWIEYASGALSQEDLRLRLLLIQPVLQMRTAQLLISRS